MLALAWYDQAHLRYTQALFTTWLSEGFVRSNAIEQAVPLLRSALATCTELGYRHLTGVVHRLLAECLKGSDVAAAAHLRQAIETIEAVDAKNERAKAWLLASSFANDLVEPSRAASVREQALQELRSLGTLHTE